jgi:uncharacterized protein YbjT (DUF2867 family)
MKTCVVAGASGLVGSTLTRMLLEDPSYSKVHLLVRKELDLDHPKLVQHLADFNQLKADLFDFKVDDAYCTLGTTIAIAGSKEAFYRVDHDFVLSFAQLSHQLGATGFFVVSSMGASSSSAIFYNKVKGETEEDLKKSGFPRLGIFRPSLLLGPRKEKRAGERFASWMMRSLDFMIPAKYKAIHVDKVAKKMVEVALRDDNGIFILESDQLH